MTVNIPYWKHMADDTSQNSQIINTIQIDVNKIKRVTGGIEKVFLLSSNNDRSPSIINVNNDILVSEFRDDSSDITQHEDDRTNYDEPCSKRVRFIKDDREEVDECKEMLKDMYKTCIQQFRDIQTTINNLTRRFQSIDEKVDILSTQNQVQGKLNSTTATSNKPGTVIVGLPQNADSNVAPMPHVGPNVTLITLNSEADFPNGSWLGDENNTEQRVRCNVMPNDLANINRTCHTAEKMALTLLDYLFDRETQACSNISGLGKHGKRQLDPLMIYGIRCHIIKKFNITDGDWHRIKQNLDSKCRTAFRRKKKGMPLTVKAFRDKWIPQEPGVSGLRLPTTAYIQMVTNPNQNGLTQGDLTDSELTSDDIDLPNTSTINIQMNHQPISLMMEDVGEPQIIHMPQGDIQVVHATAEQIAQFQQSGQLQVLAGNMIEAGDHLSLESP